MAYLRHKGTNFTATDTIVLSGFMVNVTFSGSDYTLLATGQYQGASRNMCLALGMDLVVITSHEENSFLVDLIQ